MDFNISEHLPEDFSLKSRVWIYQSSRLFMLSEAFELEKMLEDFIASWNTHGNPVTGYANLFFGRFIIFMADETSATVSGCSTDSSVNLVKAIEKKFNVDMFNRQLLNFIMRDKIEQIPLAQFDYAVEQGFIKGDTLYFNNTVFNKKELLEKWIIPLRESWLKTKLTTSQL